MKSARRGNGVFLKGRKSSETFVATPPIANNRPGRPEFAQERDNRSKKAKFIFREIGSIRATRLSPQPPPRNRVSRGRSLLGGDRPHFAHPPPGRLPRP